MTLCIRLLSKFHLVIKMALFGIFSVKFFDHMYAYALKISRKSCPKIAHFSNQSKFRKKSIEIHWTSSSLDEARRVCRQLVEQRLVACAQITPAIESLYLWNNLLELAQESRVCLKTDERLYDQVRRVIEENCSYTIPEITYTYIDGGNEPYLSWLRDSVASSSEDG